MDTQREVLSFQGIHLPCYFLNIYSYLLYFYIFPYFIPLWTFIIKPDSAHELNCYQFARKRNTS